MDARDGLKSGLLENLPDFRYGSTMAVCASLGIVLLCPQQRAWTPRRNDAKKVLADLPRDLRKVHGAKKAVAADRRNIEKTDGRRNRRAIDIGVKTIENRRSSDLQQDLQKEVVKNAKGMSNEAWQALDKQQKNMVTEARKAVKEHQQTRSRGHGLELGR
ncbi:MAG: hypothetical protein HN403_14635 [Rhodospirillales bacterium]|jgi:hypothetical protein|nr:hypothetical protein [Rhodospirillales bacterium]